MADALGFDEEPLARADFDFDDEALHSYYELHLRPHDRGAGWRRFWISAGALLPWTALCWFAAADTIGRLRDPGLPSLGLSATELPAVPWEVLVLGLGFEAVLLALFVYSIVLMWGRRPDWEQRVWQAKAEAMFRHLASGYTASPIASGIEATILPGILFPIVTLGDSWYDERISFETFWWRSSAKHVLEGKLSTHNVPFSARFYADRIEKGSHGAVFARSYRDVFDVVEDKRYPDWAIVRSSDRVSHLVVKKSALLGASWDEVKARIKDAKGEVTLREALFGDKKSRKKG